MGISDGSSDGCSSVLLLGFRPRPILEARGKAIWLAVQRAASRPYMAPAVLAQSFVAGACPVHGHRLSPSLRARSAARHPRLVEFAPQPPGQPQRPHPKIGGQAPPRIGDRKSVV